MRRVLVLAGLMLAAPLAASAQSSANVNVAATVLGGITLNVPNDLLFGNITGTGARTIAPNAAQAGRLTIQAASATPVTVTFGLPATLTGPSVGTTALSAWAGISTLSITGSAAANTPLTFNPASGPYTRTTSATGELSVFLGATLTTTAATPGSYTGTINVTVSY